MVTLFPFLTEAAAEEATEVVRWRFSVEAEAAAVAAEEEEAAVSTEEASEELINEQN